MSGASRPSYSSLPVELPAPLAATCSRPPPTAIDVTARRRPLFAAAHLPLTAARSPPALAQVHGACGVWSLAAVGLFADGRYNPSLVGIFFGGDGSLLAMALLGAMTIVAWVLFWAVPLFGLCKWCGIARFKEETEMTGIDMVEHGGAAYNPASRGSGDPPQRAAACVISTAAAEGVVEAIAEGVMLGTRHHDGGAWGVAGHGEAEGEREGERPAEGVALAAHWTGPPVVVEMLSAHPSRTSPELAI